jgi:hypothetical protein
LWTEGETLCNRSLRLKAFFYLAGNRLHVIGSIPFAAVRAILRQSLNWIAAYFRFR